MGHSALKQRSLRRSYLTFVIIAVFAPAGAARAELPTTPGEADIVFHVTDFGINQWHEAYRTGADFGEVAGGKKPNRVHTNLCARNGACDAQVLLVMPANERLAEMSHAELKAELRTQLQQKVEAAIANGRREFEIQLVQNINSYGYADQKQQALVADFGKAAYEAIGEVRENIIDQKRMTVYTDATAGSNGTVMLTRNIDSWSHYIQAIDLVDGRAGMKATIDTIDAVIRLTGKNNVRIFTAKGDHLAANRPAAILFSVPLKIIDIVTDTAAILPPLNPVKDRLGWKPQIAIGNAHVVAEIMRQRPDTEAFYTERLDVSGLPLHKQIYYGDKQFPGTGHVASMNGKEMADSSFKASRIVPNASLGYTITDPITVTYDQIRDPFRFSTSTLQFLTAPRSVPAKQAPVKISTSTVGRGGVLMNIEPEPLEADLQSLRDSILRGSDASKLSREVDAEQ